MLKAVPPNECMRAREALSARLDAELAELDAVRLDAHLRICAECRAFAGDVAGVTRRLRAAAPEPAPVGLFEPRRRRIAAPFAAAAASLVIAAAAGASFLVGQVVGARGTGVTISAAPVSASPGSDPRVGGMLQARRSGEAETGRVIAL